MMANNYVSIGQNTSYFYKFNVIDNGKHSLYTHQYMTNIMDPSSQAGNLFNTYDQNGVLDSSINFIIPVFDNMPSEKCGTPTTMDTSDPNTRYVSGTDVRLRRGPGTNYEVIKKLYTEYVYVIDFNAGNANEYTWWKVRTSDGTEGYIAYDKDYIN